MKHSYHLDSLRGLLSLIVVLQHAATAFVYSLDGLTSPINTYIGLFAHYAVMFFFVLSGYVITISINENIKRNEFFSISEYTTARCIRIIPPLIGTIILSIILMHVLIHYNAQTATGDFKFFIRKIYTPDIYLQLSSIFSATIFGNLDGGATNVNGALWSLVYEIQFYVIAGLISVILFSRRLALKTICVFLLILYWNALGVKNTTNVQWVAFICFGIGSSAYLLRDNIKRCRYAIPVVILSIACILWIKTGWGGVHSLVSEIRDHSPRDMDWVIYRIMSGILFALLIVNSEMLGKFISPFHFLSSFSYSLYIVHFPVITFMWFIIVNKFSSLVEHAYLLTISSVLISVIASYLFSRVFERPKAQKQYLTRIISAFK